MWLIPYERMTLETSLKDTEIKRRLSGYVAPVVSYMVQIKLSDKPFKGKVTSDGFEMMRVVNGRNSWLPLVIGKVESTTNVSYLNIKMRMHLVPLIVTILIIGMASLMGIHNVLFAISTGIRKWEDIIIPWGFVFIVYIYSTVVFQTEASYVKDFMTKLLQQDYKRLLKED